jgi:putative heme-binding domain-containing protein
MDLSSGLTRARVCVAVTIALAWLGLNASGSGGANFQENRIKDPAFIAEGSKLFVPNCSSSYCHGPGGLGGGAPKIRGRGLDPGYVFKTISNGIPGTPMLSFKSDLKDAELWRLVAYVVSAPEGEEKAASGPPTPSTVRAKPGRGEAPSESNGSAGVGDPAAGKSLFFDSTRAKSCQACHSFLGAGASIGPDLSTAETRAAKDIFARIVMPAESKEGRYTTWTITLRSGEKITGIKKEEDQESLRIYDVSELPAVLRTIQKTEIANTEASKESAMPRDYASIYTLKQLLDIVAFLKSSDPQKSPVSMADILK